MPSNRYNIPHPDGRPSLFLLELDDDGFEIVLADTHLRSAFDSLVVATITIDDGKLTMRGIPKDPRTPASVIEIDPINGEVESW